MQLTLNFTPYYRINTSFAIENLNGGKIYCYMEEVEIKWIQDDEAIVESTDKWLERLKWAGWKEPKKQLYRVKLKNLKPCM